MAEKTLRYNVAIDNAQALKEIDELWDYAQNGSVAASRALNQTLGGTVKTVLDWEVRVDEKGIKKLQPVVKEVLTEYDKLNNKANQVNKTQEGSVTQLRQQVNNAKQVRDGIAKIATETNKAAGTVRGQLNPEWVKADQKVKDLNISLAEAEGGIFRIARAKFSSFGELLKIGNALTQFNFVAQAVGQAFQVMNAAIQPLIQREKQIQGLRLALSAFVADQESASAVLSSAKGIALQYGGSLTQIERAYKRIAPTILASGGDLQDVEIIVESLSAKTTQLGLNTEQAGRYIEAFAQVMGKGKLQSEELNQQFSELDGALRSQIALYLETEHGITNIEDAMRNGEVTAGLFREAFIAAAKSARDELGGAIDNLGRRINSLNIQQLENIRNTLNTITLESLNDTFGEFGMSMQRIGTALSAFFASITTDLPNLTAKFTELFDGLGYLLELLIVGFVNGIKIILIGLDKIVGLIERVKQGFESLPAPIRFLINPFGSLSGIVLKFKDSMQETFNEGTYEILKLGNSVNTAKGQFTTLVNSAEELRAKFESGAITQEEYKKSLESLYQNATEGSKQLLTAYQEEQEAVNALKEKINERFEQEAEQIQSQIDKKKEALDAEKEGLKGVLDNLKQSYDARKALIDEEIQKVKERYDLELERINAQTPAQKEQVRLRKEKLQAIVNSSKATYEEKVAAQASLDTMRQQEESAIIRARQAEELKALEQKAAEEKKKYEADRKAAEEASLARQKGIEDAIKGLTEKLKTNEEKQKEYNERLDESVRINDEIIDTIDDIPGLIDEQIDASNRAKNAYWEQYEAVKAIREELDRINQAKANAKPTGENRFAGGPVSGGATYTVNELGREGFLSASGKLSAINAPAWGQWRAPGAGTVVPADIFATIQATATTRGASTASANTRLTGSSSQLLTALRSIGAGDNIQNNVTIQSTNPNKTASDMLVELTKIKRRRYS